MIKVFKKSGRIVEFVGSVTTLVEDYQAAKAAKVMEETQEIFGNLKDLAIEGLETTLVVKKSRKAASTKELKGLREDKRDRHAFAGRRTASHRSIDRSGSLRYAQKLEILAEGARWFERAGESIPRTGYLAAFLG